MFCKNCGAEVSGGNFCSYCGQALTETTSSISLLNKAVSTAAYGGKWRMMPHVQKREGISMKTVI